MLQGIVLRRVAEVVCSDDVGDTVRPLVETVTCLDSYKDIKLTVRLWHEVGIISYTRTKHD